MNASKPDIIVFMTDQQHCRTIGGRSVCKTPNLNALLQSGTLFDNAFCPTPICTPSRASCQTGLLPHQHRLVHNTHRNYHILEDLPTGTKTLGNIFSDAGYQTGYAGKWHVGKNKTPLDFGYKHFPQTRQHKADANSHKDPVFIPGTSGKSIISAVSQTSRENTEPFLVAETADSLIRDFSGRSEPFFLFISTLSPHVPWICPKEYADLYNPGEIDAPSSYSRGMTGKPYSYKHHYNGHNDCRFPDDWKSIAVSIARYYGICTLIDDAFGAIIESLKRNGRFDNTWIIFTSDHGEMLGEHGMIGKGEYLLDDLIRIPLAIKAPAGIPSRIHADEFVGLTDIFATLADAAGLKTEIPASSRSLLPLLEKAGSREIFPDEMVTEHHGSMFFNTVRALRTADFKYVFRAHEDDELYDLKKDPGEMVNLVADSNYAPTLLQMRKRLVEKMTDSGDMAAKGAESELFLNPSGGK
ncbi:MAG: sulfatase-like hydrolase/transferase [Victivallales bacterium]|jgi:arylsulfatase A-like enzyme